MRTPITPALLAVLLLVLVLVPGLAGCDRKAAPTAAPPAAAETARAVKDDAPPALELVRAFPERQLTGVAVSPEGRVFVNFPRWGGPHEHSVVELLSEGGSRPYPDEAWNRWDPAGGDDPATRLVCVQSVVVDDRGTLWILDPAAPGLRSVVPGGPKLLRVDLAEDRVERVYAFDRSIAPEGSYLNDLRVETATGTAFLTDSGLGALIVLDLESGAARRVLDGHPSTVADPALVPVIGGREWLLPGGDVPAIHADGIALDTEAGRLYWHALTGRRLYALATRDLRDPELSEEELASRIEDLGDTVVTDGMLVDPAGRVLHTALERDAIVAWSPGGGLETVIADPDLAWPDSLALGPEGRVYVTTSQIHLSPVFGTERTEPYKLLSFRLP
jgi:sugar lactone lactonase YvrE